PISHLADAVGVISVNRAVALGRERVHRTGTARAAAQFLGEFEGVELERHGDIETLAALGKKCAGGTGKAAELDQLRAINESLPQLRGELGVYLWRAAVLDRVAENRITIDLGIDLFHQSTHSRGCRKCSVSAASGLPGSGR